MIVPEDFTKSMLAGYGLLTPRGYPAESTAEVARIARELGELCVVKALIPTGGRGKAGGVKLCRSVQQAQQAAEGLLGQQLLGHQVKRVLVEEIVPLAGEFYAGVIANTATDKIDLVLSLAGGVEIENTARNDQHSVYQLSIQPGDLLPVYRVRRWLAENKIDLPQLPELAKTLVALYRAAADLDAVLLEINPLALAQDGRLILLDAKLEVDDNAISRHPELNDFFIASLGQRELRARQLGVSYVPLDGDIGVITSGAGLGMATLDLLQQRGLSPANFLDTGGGISEEMVKGAVELILEPPQIKGVMINLYGGINRMLEAAKGITAALENIPDDRPLVVKILGNQQEEAWELLDPLPNVYVIRQVQTETAVERLAQLLT
jgi:succinyl-CoA synthetase beta subunit